MSNTSKLTTKASQCGAGHCAPTLSKPGMFLAGASLCRVALYNAGHPVDCPELSNGHQAAIGIQDIQRCFKRRFRRVGHSCCGLWSFGSAEWNDWWSLDGLSDHPGASKWIESWKQRVGLGQSRHCPVFHVFGILDAIQIRKKYSETGGLWSKKSKSPRRLWYLVT